MHKKTTNKPVDLTFVFKGSLIRKNDIVWSHKIILSEIYRWLDQIPTWIFMVSHDKKKSVVIMIFYQFITILNSVLRRIEKVCPSTLTYSVDLKLDHRPRGWPTIKTTLGQRLVIHCDNFLVQISRQLNNQHQGL